ncbi:hypothetical protein POVWA2_001050 [Plasmodium ovale wallikeri]|uniref:Uncharacterized protein n=1 Tax=Plasmodium ovale wallikeri TaxID=864142 RepID=A0A1A8YHX2_PLAOA|nr:hypothetical protein POVWA2_001050 [Plasmodium ovale wallikeri]
MNRNVPEAQDALQITRKSQGNEQIGEKDATEQYLIMRFPPITPFTQFGPIPPICIPRSFLYRVCILFANHLRRFFFTPLCCACVCEKKKKTKKKIHNIITGRLVKKMYEWHKTTWSHQPYAKMKQTTVGWKECSPGSAGKKKKKKKKKKSKNL